jgi:co-chaperonin GroES (HSP10)
MIKAVGYWLLVKRDDITDHDPVFKSAKQTGIVLAETEEHARMQAAIDRGVVVGVGPQAYSETKKDGLEPWCKLDDLVIFAKYSGKAVENEGTKYILIKDDDVIAVIS